MSDWRRVCALEDVGEREVKGFEAHGTEIAVARSAGGYHAFPLHCPHLEESLSEGKCDGVTLTCVYHYWQWDLATGASTGEAALDLLSYPVKTEAGDLFVDLETVLDYV